MQPFGNSLVKMDLTGQQIIGLLNQQFPPAQTSPRILQGSGLTYTWDANGPAGNKIVSVLIGGVAIDKAAIYSATVNSFLATGGDGFAVLNSGTNRVGGPLDIDALVDYIKSIPQPVSPPTVGSRITRLNRISPK